MPPKEKYLVQSHKNQGIIWKLTGKVVSLHPFSGMRGSKESLIFDINMC